MYQVVWKDVIVISRGDYALIPIRLIGAEEGEEVIFSVSDKIDPETAIIEKHAFVNESMIFIALTQEETRALKTGEYLWDVSLPDFWGEGQRHTPITPKVFKITGVSHIV